MQRPRFSLSQDSFDGRPLRSLIAIFAGATLIAVSSWAEIPMRPVPITLQTFAVTLIAGLCGWRIGVVATLLWLGLGAAGLPVLAGGSGGLDRFTGATAGYLFAFPLAALLVGRLITSRRMRGAIGTILLMLLGNLLCLTIGAAWLAGRIGAPAALDAGFLPFLPGALLKSLAGGLIVHGLRRRDENRTNIL